ncbi:MAG: type II toxin-antitoxin system VapC family toxin [Intrasporangium sp.]|uniref:type II toxin-antitoxin system VapC family toxin n=1 Tax=Intrasporangium sp. TaxID=1925024 RepID=UPI002647FB62|nr:type II toxin-antitoxin system VapC family toxin [Intrasporangium sp.]MDN5797813.1 type II toxin-antitoxin system VapC family toxin [Intrasporangium sp.]
MTHLLIDTSVLVKWFHSEGEAELPVSRTLRRAHLVGDVDAHMLDLATYQIGNVLIRALRWEPSAAADQLDDLHTNLGSPLVMTADWLRYAATLAYHHGLTFHDASWAATPDRLNMPLISADRHFWRRAPPSHPVTLSPA